MPAYEHNGFNMHYEVHGQGEPVILIMGITAPGTYWEDHLAEWAQHFQCTAPDNRGVGLSDKPAGDYSSEMMADDYAHLMDHLGIEKAHIVGCSMGSIIAQQLSIRHPEKVKSQVLMCSWARCDSYAKSVFDHILRSKAHMRHEHLVEFLHLLIFNKRSWDDSEFHKGMLEGREDAAAEQNPQPLHGLEGQCAACVNHNTLEHLKNITAPTLLIGGEDDIFTPRWMADELHAGIPNSQLHLYPKSGHAFHWENLEDFNQRVTEFIKANS
ncbi:alpha/beta hydrolase fold protein [Oceaniferula spumae]|uniref:Alpha/beta hydrolase fold protein n=1 Tax=Oceaniferula spumae TaxID=2979115 RepID=A0AAT9FNG6_9BACT